jgi:hypothetical protein
MPIARTRPPCLGLILSLVGFSASLLAPAAAQQAAPPATPAPLVWTDPDITGAQLDESTIRAEVVVDPAATPGGEAATTLAEGFARALRHLEEGTPTRLRIKAGLYREAVPNLGFDKGDARDTLFVIEGEAPGRVVITGADVFPVSAWKDHGGGLYSTPWAHRFAHASPDWGPPRQIGHRAEMVFLGQSALRQALLDLYEVKGIGQSLSALEKKMKPSWTYQRSLDPRETLRPGEFGVSEHADDGGRLYVRLAPGEKLPAAGLEVSVRRVLVDLGARGNLVLRNLTATRAANTITGARPINLGGVGDFKPRNVLVERCAFLWNNGTAFSVNGEGWTLRDNRFNYNGSLGITGWGASEMLWERNQTSFNGWRVWRGGEVAWFSGGVKLHYTKRHWVRGHTSIGNVSTGFHYDIACRDIWNEDLVLIDNAPGSLCYELGVGPFLARRVLAVGGSMNYATTMRLWSVKDALVEDSIFYNNYSGLAWGNAEPAILAEALLSRRTDSHARMDPFEGSILRIHRSVFAIGDKQPRLLSIGDRRPSATPEQLYRWEGRDNVFAIDRAPGAEDFKIRELGAKVSFGSLADWKTSPMVDEQNLQTARRALRDPEAGDFRPVAEGPVGALAPRLPTYVMPPEVRAARDSFFAWVGYDRKTGDLTSPDSRSRSAEIGRIDPLD